ncbi:UDP-3-O-acyl-N-acetylglucosamine deacetylase [Geomesophilobacter sediminis]|uniref:UDP-3-O-acyl-N-acetylglucosamine deacetylase n=1 Tax=Geomesophilobacter sediminis TaxID=2798584 RepID=A0A8J7LZ09_9BACT|nr:UDP-3-O-acyl-N-acetylglucosamine deacetylase [Geomesophilobacter sediminis]MBJ6725887.1 UDP-3-O-acyl-N-acetylglucosamine deacetylase [Geomesophilobacter sediminis]
MIFQKTIRNKTTFSGIGLHTGKTITMTVRPADAGTGIVFHRVDLSPAVSIEAKATNVVDTRLSTTVGNAGGTVSTIEHLMAALFAAEIDNAHIDIDGPEVPVMDGSARIFAEQFAQVGVQGLSKARRFLVIKKSVTLTEGDKKISIHPARRYQISFDLQYDHPVVGHQFHTFQFDPKHFGAEIAPARTFGFEKEFELLKSHGLGRGASLENAVGISDEGILNPEGLRFSDEFVRHKILDALGDLSLAGFPLIGHVKALKSGHDMNNKLLREVLNRPDCYEITELVRPAANTQFIPELAWLEA